MKENIFLLIMITISSCAKNADVECYRTINKPVAYCFYYEGGYYNSYGFTGFKKNDLGYLVNEKINWIDDTLYTFQVGKVKNSVDTVFYANLITCHDNRCFVFNGILGQNQWNIGLYYPYELKGSYSFNISAAERKLFNYAVFLLNKKDSFIIPQKEKNSTALSIVYVKLREKHQQKEYFADMDESVPEEYVFFNEVIMTISRKNIQPKNKISQEIKNLESRLFFNNLSEEYKTGSALIDVELGKKMMDSILVRDLNRK